MQLTRKQSITIAAAALIIFMLLSIVYLRQDQQLRATTGQPGQDELQAELALTPTPKNTNQASPTAKPTGSANTDIIMKRFHRSEIKDGQTLWEIEGAYGQYFPDQQAAEIQQARLQVYREPNRSIILEADRALLTIDGTDLSKAELFDGVTLVDQQGVTATTEQATYDRSTGTLTSPGVVQINSDLVDITGRILEADVDEQIFHLKRNVESVIRPTEHKQQAMQK